MRKEIGSEFWEVDSVVPEKRFFQSGRAALEFIVRDAVAEHGSESALLPSLCCHTMIEPFVRNGLSVRFYDVYFQDGLKACVPLSRGKEIFFQMGYFGYSQLEGLSYGNIREQWDCVIEDCTHSWLSNGCESGGIGADYRFASFRKWTGLTGIACAEKRAGSFVIEQKYDTNVNYEVARKLARGEKREYILEESEEKTGYLEKFDKAENTLEEEYRDFAPSLCAMQEFLNLDIEGIKLRRRQNADYLIDQLGDCEGIQLAFSERKSGDTPLCVPIFVRGGLRDSLREHLIAQEIYCPVHWPLSAFHRGISGRVREVYEQELSLICDQRYGVEDMARQVNAVRDFFMGRQHG